MSKSTKLNVAINGFGRIGRSTLKALLSKSGVNVVAINDLTDPATLAHLLKHDSSYRTYNKSVRATKSALIVEGKTIPVFAEKEPEKLPWKLLAVDVVLECTGRFTKKEEAARHLKGGARRVIISAPGKGTPTILLGVNEHKYRREKVINMGSCTTNCIAPVIQVIEKKFGV